MNNAVAKVCKITAVIIFIFAFIGSIIIGNIFKMQNPEYKYIDDLIFNYPLMLSSWVCSFLFCLFLFALGEIINQLVISNETENVNNEILKQQNERIIHALADIKQTTNSNTNSNSFNDLPNL